MTRCHYCDNEATVCCEERIGSTGRRCPRVVCDRHAALIDGLRKCFGHALPADDKKPWER